METFVWTLVAMALMVLSVFWYAKRRPPGTPLTWGEASLAATYAFFLMWWAYAIVPHWWLTWADSELGWRKDKFFTGPGNILQGQSKGGWFPIDISYQAIRDIIAVLIYVFFLGLQMFMWSAWQNRGKKTVEIETSDYGRPLVKGGTR